MRSLLVVCLLTLSLFGSQIKWSSNYDMARYKATKENKHVLVFVSAKDSPFCDIMKIDTFGHPDVVNLVNKYFVAIELSLGLDRIPVGIKVFSAPSVYFLTNKGKEIYRHIVGEVSPKRMIEILEDVHLATENKMIKK